MAKTNRVGYFHRSVAKNVVVHIDSSAKASSECNPHEKAFIGTGWVAHADKGVKKDILFKDQLISFGGSVECVDPVGSHLFEFYGVVNALRDLLPEITNNSRKPNVVIALDNRSVVIGINDYAHSRKRPTIARALPDRYWNEFTQQAEKINIRAVWEKGHVSHNIANFSADKIALSLRKSAECFGDLKPLHMQSIVLQTAAKRLLKNGLKAFQDRFLSPYAVDTFSTIENAVVISLTKYSKDNRISAWSVSKDGKMVMSGTVDTIHKNNGDRSRTLSEVMLAYRTSEHFESERTVYLTGNLLYKLDGDFYNFCKGATEHMHESTRYNIETIMTGLTALCLTTDDRKTYIDTESKKHDLVMVQTVRKP